MQPRRFIAIPVVLALLLASSTAVAYDLDRKAPGPKVEGKRVGASDCKTDHWEKLVWKRKVTIGPRGLKMDKVVPSHTEPCYVPPPPEPTPVTESAGQPATAAPVDSTGAPLAAIAACESGGDPTAVSPDGTYRGAYQFDAGTWASVGGSGDPAAASMEEQTYRAGLLYEQSGASPWPVCGQ